MTSNHSIPEISVAFSSPASKGTMQAQRKPVWGPATVLSLLSAGGKWVLTVRATVWKQKSSQHLGGPERSQDSVGLWENPMGRGVRWLPLQLCHAWDSLFC